MPVFVKNCKEILQLSIFFTNFMKIKTIILSFVAKGAITKNIDCTSIQKA
jgi:hypothetical protein